MPKDENQGRIVSGRYRLLDELGTGAQGAVYLAEDLGRGGMRVALKLVDDVVGGAREEPADQRLRHFRHPHWASVLDAGPHELGGWFQVLDFVEGRSLDQLPGPQPVEHVWALLEQGARVLGAMHRQGLIHYDVTPGNVMLDDTGDAPRFVLTDGGLAHIGAVEGVARGTPAFMAPEVTESGSHDHRADLYSLGLVAFRLATGRDPIEDSGSNILARRRREDAPRARSLRPELPGALDDLLAALLDRQPSARPHDALDLLARIGAARDEPIERFTHAEAVTAAEGGPHVGAEEGMARVDAAIDSLAQRRRLGGGRAAAARAPKLEEPVLLVQGPAGSGATRLTEEAIARARDAALPALLMASGSTTEDPLQLFVEGMAALQRAPGEAIEPIALDLGRHRDLGHEDRSHATTRAIESFLRGVETTAERTPFVLVVQDFPELPARAQEAVRVLARHLQSFREHGGSTMAPAVALLVDLGEAEADDLLVPDAADPRAVILAVPPLRLEEVRTFLSDRYPGLTPDDADLERIAAVSRGLPGTVAALLAEGSRRDELHHEAGAWSWNIAHLEAYEIPAGLSPVMSQALAEADATLRDQLRYLGLLDAPVPARTMAKLVGEASPDRLTNNPLLRRHTVVDQSAFSLATPALQAWVRSELPADDTLVVRLATVLTEADHPWLALDLARLLCDVDKPKQAIEALARHWEHLDSNERNRAQATIRVAADALSLSELDPASRTMLAGLLEYGREAALVAERLSHVLAVAEDQHETIVAVLSLLAAARREEPAMAAARRLLADAEAGSYLAAELAMQVVSLGLNLGRTEESRRYLESAADCLREARNRGRGDAWPLRARVFMARAQHSFLANRPMRARRALLAAQACASRAKSASLLARVYSNIGIVEQQLGETDSATATLERALHLRKAIGDQDGVLSTLTNLGRIHQHRGSLVKSAALFQESASRALRHALPKILARALIFLGRIYDQQMNTRLAAETLQRSLDTSLRAELPQLAAKAAWDLAPIAAALGDLGMARRTLLHSALAARSRQGQYSRAMHHFAAAVTSMHSGDDRRALLCFDRAQRHDKDLYPSHSVALSNLQPLLALLGDQRHHGRIPSTLRRDMERPSLRIGLWLERCARSERNIPMPPLRRFLPRPNATTSASGEDRRLLVEAVIRLAQHCSHSDGALLLAATEKHLALTGERRLHSRVLALRSMSQREEAAAEAARAYSRSVELLDPAGYRDPVKGWQQAIPQEHLRAFTSHQLSLSGGFGDTPPSQTGMHALAHQLLLRYGYTAAPDGRVSRALRRVLAATGRMNAGAGLGELLEDMNTDTIEITGAERACVVLIDPTSRKHMRVEKGISSEDLGIEVEDLSQTVIQRVIDSREPLLMHDVFDDQELMGRPSITSLSLRSILCVPMLRGDNLFGVLYADSASAAGSFDSVDQEVLSLFAEQAAAALETHRLVADVQNSMAELKAMQERLVRGERLRTMGELSSSVAHEFNNLLTSILARVQLISLDPVAPELKRDLDLIEKACMDAAEVVRRLQSFTRQQREGDFQRVDLAEICRDAVEFLRPLWSTRRRHGRPPVTVKLRTDDTLPMQGNGTELREVVTNLLKNSLDALADGGSIDIEAGAIPGGLLLRFEDDGPGIPADVQARVFDPFFTTKGERGTGLGLCLSQQIIERHGGEMTLWSEPGKGTRFTIELPLRAAPAKPAPEEPAARAVEPLKVLVVDDDENVLLPLCTFLERSGYALASAEDGEAGLARALEMRPDVVISDVAMPGMNGIELCRRLKQEIPDTPVILMSGWASGIDPSRARRAGAATLLKKPFALQQVELALREIRDLRGPVARAAERG